MASVEIELVLLLMAAVPDRLDAGDPWQRCAGQMSLAPVVRLPDGRYANLFLDMPATKALAVAVDQISVPVLPFLDTRPLAYRSKDVILVSTAFISTQENPRTLRSDLLRLPILRGGQTADYRHCIAEKPILDEYWIIRMARFEEAARKCLRSREPHLKSRPAQAAIERGSDRDRSPLPTPVSGGLPSIFPRWER